MGCGRAQLIKFQITWARPGPARHINISILSARPGPAHDIRSEAHETRDLYCPARGIEEPVHGYASGAGSCVTPY